MEAPATTKVQMTDPTNLLIPKRVLTIPSILVQLLIDLLHSLDVDPRALAMIYHR